MKTYSSQAVVLSKRNHSEADKVITLFSRDYGKIILIAKSVRKPSSRKRGALESFNQIRFSAVESKTWDILTEAQVIQNFEAVKSDLKKTSVAYFLVEVVSKLTQEKEPNQDIYFILLSALENLQRSKTLKILRRQFVRDMLVTLGFWPANLGMDNPDKILQDIAERQFSTVRVGKKILEG